MSAVQWSALLDRAEAAGEDLAELPSSAFLDRVLEDCILGLVPGSGWPKMSYCSHTAQAAELEDFNSSAIFTSQMLAACAPCARDIRGEAEGGRKRTCQRCDTARATELHRAELLGASGPVLAVPLCEGCAAAEALLDVVHDRVERIRS